MIPAIDMKDAAHPVGRRGHSVCQWRNLLRNIKFLVDPARDQIAIPM
jgi:hypothetical protein